MVTEFVKIAYCTTVPVLLAASVAHRTQTGKNALNLMAATNLLLSLNSLFLGRQLYAFYELAVSLHIHPSQPVAPDYWLAARILLLLILPFFSILKPVRGSRLFSLVLLVLLFDFYPPSTWYMYDAAVKTIMYVCLLCSVYALLWLLNQLPHQYPSR